MSEWENNIKRIFNTNEEGGQPSPSLGYGLVGEEAVKNMVLDFWVR